MIPWSNFYQPTNEQQFIPWKCSTNKLFPYQILNGLSESLYSPEKLLKKKTAWITPRFFYHQKSTCSKWIGKNRRLIASSSIRTNGFEVWVFFKHWMIFPGIAPTLVEVGHDVTTSWHDGMMAISRCKRGNNGPEPMVLTKTASF